MNPVGVYPASFLWTVLAVALIPGVATGEVPPQQNSLSWTIEEGAVECPASEALRSRLVARMGHDPLDEPTSPRFDVRLRRVDGKYQAEIGIVTDGVATTRSIGGDANTCDEIVDAVAFTLSLLLQSEPSVAPPTPLEPPPQVAPPVAPPCDRSPCPPCVTPAPERGRTAWLGAGALFGYHDLPELGKGGALAMGLEVFDGWEAAAGALWLKEESRGRDGAIFAFSLSEGWLGLGPSVAFAERWHWRSDVGPALGVLHSYALNPQPLDPGDSYYLGLQGRTHVRVRLVGPLGVAAGLSAELRLKRWEFRVRNASDVVWRQPWLGARAEMLAIWEVE